MKKLFIFKKLFLLTLTTFIIISLGACNKVILPKPAPQPEPDAPEITAMYYGDKSICKITPNMAAAYKEVLAKEQSFLDKSYSNSAINVYAVLMDLAGDGVPILLTIFSDGDYVSYPEGREAINIYGWNGKEAERYDFVADTEMGYTFDYCFYPGNQKAMISVGDGCALQVGDADGTMDYVVSDGSIQLVHHKMTYTAYADEDSDYITFAGKLPGYSYYDRSVSVQELLDAGWMDMSDENTIGKILYAYYEDDELIEFANPDEYYSYIQNGIDERNRLECYNLYDASTGDSQFLADKWDSAENMMVFLDSVR